MPFLAGGLLQQKFIMEKKKIEKVSMPFLAGGLLQQFVSRELGSVLIDVSMPFLAGGLLQR